MYTEILLYNITSSAIINQSRSSSACPSMVQREDKVVAIKGYTRAMVRTMTEANKIPHFGYNDEVIEYSF
jgi:hypothetical protein